jgi:hypothetical protein
MGRLHPTILSAKTSAERYRVKRGDRGWSIWRFWDWDQDPCGYHRIAAGYPTEAEAWISVLERLGLGPDDDPKPAPVMVPQVTWTPGYDIDLGYEM